MKELLQQLADNWRFGVEILIISGLIYFAVRRFGSRNWARLVAMLGSTMLLLLLVSYLLDLVVIPWLVASGALFFTIALLVGFQPELRRALADLGDRGFLFFSEGKNREFLDHLADAVRQLGAKRYGALFAIERGIELKPHLETGVHLDAHFSPELALTIFHPKTALHDGAVILREGRVVGAGCLFPVSQREIADRSIGLRHRAGLGITEESDAIAIIVSEELGSLSIAHGGELERDLEPDDFRRRLLELLEMDPDVVERDREAEGSGSPSDPPRPKKGSKSKSKAKAGDTTLLSGGTS